MINATLDYNTLSADGKKLTLVVNGIGHYEVVTGRFKFNNDVNCSFKDDAPIPLGTYYITERDPGSLRNQINNFGLEIYRNVFEGKSNDKSNWFSLINTANQDNSISVNNHNRGGFKLHPLNSDGSGYSDGCVTLFSYNEFMMLRKALLQHSPSLLKQKNGKATKVYGILTVVGRIDFSKCTIE